MNLHQAKQIAAEFPNVRFVHDRRTDRWSFADPRSDAASEFTSLIDTTETAFIKLIEEFSREFAKLHGEAPYGLATCRGYRTPSV